MSRQCRTTLMVLIFAGTNFRESKINAFRGYLFSRINTDFMQISLFYADFDGISEKSTFRGYLISRNQQKVMQVDSRICYDVFTHTVDDARI